MTKVKRALISVSDKTGIVDFARNLSGLGVEILSTGGTAKALREAKIKVIDVSEVTGFPEILDGRVKTLHPMIHGGLLALRENPGHMEQIEKLRIKPIDMVVVNLYPFEKTISKPGCPLEEAIENIDIGGPSMLRSAAKNYTGVAVIVNPKHYGEVLNELRSAGSIGEAIRKRLMVEVFAHTAAYDRIIHRYLAEKFLAPMVPGTSDEFVWKGRKVSELRYGENPHQKAAFYVEENAHEPSVSTAEVLHGKALSFNNIMDSDAAIELVKEFREPAAIVIKHTNPCGAATGNDIDEAYRKAFDADPLSAFGGIVALNRILTEKIAEHISGRFLEVIIAPDFEPHAMEILSKKADLRLLKIPGLDKPISRDADTKHLRKVTGGLLVQERDLAEVTEKKLQAVTKKAPEESEIADLLFAWKVVKHVKSNAIVIAKNCQTLGVGAGQMNRVGSVKIASEQAGDNAKGAVLASDAMFPKPDSIEQAAAAGISAIIQTGGSKQDKAVIEEADRRGIAMVFTGVRHFKH